MHAVQQPTRRVGMHVVFACAGLMFAASCASPPEAGEHITIPAALDLPADFKVQQTDWVDSERANSGWFLQLKMLRGKAIKERNGVHPIHVMRAELPQYEGDPFRVDDLIIGVNGVPLGVEPADQFAQEVIRTRKRTRLLTVTRWRAGTIATVTLQLEPEDEEVIPDLTKGGTPNETRDWALGPIGANGWGYSVSTGRGGSSKARQLLITRVDGKGPAAGRLEVGDVITGVDGKDFTTDARRALAHAINEAEKTEHGGQLRLRVWRDGTASEVALSLRVLGAYSASSPFDCPKTDRIIDDAVACIKANRGERLKPSREGWINDINALGLLATGRDDVLAMVRALAHASLLEPGETLSVEKHVSMQCWWWSYKTVFLCEYCLHTGDRAVLPTIEELATKIAMGQSGAGTGATRMPRSRTRAGCTGISAATGSSTSRA